MQGSFKLFAIHEVSSTVYL